MVRPSNPRTSSISTKFLFFVSGLFFFALLISACLVAQSDEWTRLNQESVSLYQQGDYRRATELAQKALELAERELGPEHPIVAVSLNNLAEFHREQGQYAQAEPLYNHPFAI